MYDEEREEEEEQKAHLHSVLPNPMMTSSLFMHPETRPYAIVCVVLLAIGLTISATYKHCHSDAKKNGSEQEVQEEVLGNKK